MARKTYYLKDPKDLNIRFYQSYDEGYLLRKAEIIASTVDNFDEFTNFLEVSKNTPTFEKQKYLEMLNAELHFSEFQQFEAFFAIFIAIFQELPHWLYLTTYTTREIKQKVKAFLEKDIKTVTNGFIENINELINEAIYANFLSDKEEIAHHWQANIDNIVWFIGRIAHKYLEGTEYNAYKHGLRTFTGPTYFQMFPTGEPERGIRFESDDSIRFLELDEIEKSVFSSQRNIQTLQSYRKYKPHLFHEWNSGNHKISSTSKVKWRS